MDFHITAAEANDLNENQDDFKKYNTVTPVFVKTSAWKAGDILVQKDLAKTLERIRDNGQKGFYEGETARLIVEEMQRGKGLISYEDLKNYTAKEREPVIFNYKKDLCSDHYATTKQWWNSPATDDADGGRPGLKKIRI